MPSEPSGGSDRSAATARRLCRYRVPGMHIAMALHVRSVGAKPRIVGFDSPEQLPDGSGAVVIKGCQTVGPDEPNIDGVGRQLECGGFLLKPSGRVHDRPRGVRNVGPAAMRQILHDQPVLIRAALQDAVFTDRRNHVVATSRHCRHPQCFKITETDLQYARRSVVAPPCSEEPVLIGRSGLQGRTVRPLF